MSETLPASHPGRPDECGRNLGGAESQSLQKLQREQVEGMSRTDGAASLIRTRQQAFCSTQALKRGAHEIQRKWSHQNQSAHLIWLFHA